MARASRLGDPHFFRDPEAAIAEVREAADAAVGREAPRGPRPFAAPSQDVS